MIRITSLQGEEMFINPDLIERMRSIPDTVLYLKDDKRLPVLDTPQQIIDRIVAYRRAIFSDALNLSDLKVTKVVYEPENPDDK